MLPSSNYLPESEEFEEKGNTNPTYCFRDFSWPITLTKIKIAALLLPVNTDGHQVENRRRAACDVHGDVKVAGDVRQIPLEIHLKRG